MMTNLRLKTVFRYDEIQGHFRLFRVMWEKGEPGKPGGRLRARQSLMS